MSEMKKGGGVQQLEMWGERKREVGAGSSASSNRGVCVCVLGAQEVNKNIYLYIILSSSCLDLEVTHKTGGEGRKAGKQKIEKKTHTHTGEKVMDRTG